MFSETLSERMLYGITVLAGILFSPVLLIFGPIYLLGWACQIIGNRLGFDL